MFLLNLMQLLEEEVLGSSKNSGKKGPFHSWTLL